MKKNSSRAVKFAVNPSCTNTVLCLKNKFLTIRGANSSLFLPHLPQASRLSHFKLVNKGIIMCKGKQLITHWESYTLKSVHKSYHSIHIHNDNVTSLKIMHLWHVYTFCTLSLCFGKNKLQYIMHHKICVVLKVQLLYVLLFQVSLLLTHANIEWCVIKQWVYIQPSMQKK